MVIGSPVGAAAGLSELELPHAARSAAAEISTAAFVPLLVRITVVLHACECERGNALG